MALRPERGQVPSPSEHAQWAPGLVMEQPGPRGAPGRPQKGEATCQHLMPVPFDPAPHPPEDISRGHWTRAAVGSTEWSPDPRGFSQQKAHAVTRGSRPPAFEVERKEE